MFPEYNVRWACSVTLFELFSEYVLCVAAENASAIVCSEEPVRRMLLSACYIDSCRYATSRASSLVCIMHMSPST